MEVGSRDTVIVMSVVSCRTVSPFLMQYQSLLGPPAGR